MLLSALTPRRVQTLEALQRLSQPAGKAVHYSLVAARMRISSWTAYGLLRELEKIGLVTRRYDRSSRRGKLGRSRILFVPLSAPARPSAGKSSLGDAFERFAEVRDEAVAARAYLAEAGTDLAYHLGFWLGRMEAAGRQAGDAARTVLESGAGPAAKIQIVASMGVGSALARLGRSRLASRVAAAANRFSLMLDEASRASDNRLAELVDAARHLQPERRSRLAT
jgi:hypothetical protein